MRTCHTVELNTIAAENRGFIINGIANDDCAGFSVKDAGDVNGDGKADLIIGAPYADPNGPWSGQSYVVFGKSNNNTIELANLNNNGFIINGATRNNYSGFSVSGAGDVNGDGKADLIIGAFNADPYGIDSAGQSYVVFGKSDARTVELGNLGNNGFIINGIAKGDWAGNSVSGAGDVNSDGKADLVIGAPEASPNGVDAAGQSYVVFGKSDTTTVELSSLGNGGFTINGISKGDWSGTAVSGAGDVNGDGKADLIICAPGADAQGLDSGQNYVVFGKSDSNTVELSNLGNGGFIINGVAEHDSAGKAISGAGDINGDGKGDLIIGAFGADPHGSSSGQSYVVFGKRDTSTIELGNLGNGGFIINGAVKGDLSGYSVSGAGDINGDGKTDIVIGAPYADPNGSNSAGQSYVVFGKSDVSSVELGDLKSNGFTINGAAKGDTSGYSVSGGLDVNGDGIPDLIIGAPNANPQGIISAGQSYVVYGGCSDQLSPSPKPGNSTSSQPLSSGALALIISLPLGGFLILLLVVGWYIHKKRTNSRYNFFKPDNNDESDTVEMGTLNTAGSRR